MHEQKPLVLVVDDDPALLKLMGHSLGLAGYQIITASEGKTALQLIVDSKPALVFLDIMMPGMDGFQVCERVRQFSQVPIIMLTAKTRSEDVIHGLEISADDYIVKPFSVDVALARVKAVLRRAHARQETIQPTLIFGELSIDLASQRVTLDGTEVVLTPTEYRILSLLARHAGSIVTHDYLLTQVWGGEYRGDTHVLQAAINRLRKKIGDTARDGKYITSRSGIGYIFGVWHLNGSRIPHQLQRTALKPCS
jgi:two-component system KDP operon response regulator KdpE